MKKFLRSCLILASVPVVVLSPTAHAGLDAAACALARETVVAGTHTDDIFGVSRTRGLASRVQRRMSAEDVTAHRQAATDSQSTNATTRARGEATLRRLNRSYGFSATERVDYSVVSKKQRVRIGVRDGLPVIIALEGWYTRPTKESTGPETTTRETVVVMDMSDGAPATLPPDRVWLTGQFIGREATENYTGRFSSWVDSKVPSECRTSTTAPSPLSIADADAAGTVYGEAPAAGSGTDAVAPR